MQRFAIIVHMMILPLLFAILTSATDVADALRHDAIGEKFNLTATVTDYNQDEADFAVEDNSGPVIMSHPKDKANISLKIGDRINTHGIIRMSTHDGHVHAQCHYVNVIGSAKPSPIRQTSIHEVASGALDACVVRVTGELIDCFQDEIDSTNTYMILAHDGESVYLTMPKPYKTVSQMMEKLLWRELTVTGVCDPRPSGTRRNTGRTIKVHNMDALVPCDTKQIDIFDVPPISNPNHIQPAEIVRLGRRRISGRVIAVWHSDTLLIKTSDGRLSRIRLFKPEPPRYGDMVDVVGFPETDLYRINLTKAFWRMADSDSGEYIPSVTNITASALITHSNGRTMFKASFHGATVRVQGIVRALPGIGDSNERLYLESDGRLLPVDASGCPKAIDGISLGSLVEVTATCIMDVENWQPNQVFPHIKEALLVVREPSDIVTIRRPAWWTPTKLTTVIGSLLITLIASLIWNRTLHSLANKRGKAFANEELQRLEADLKVLERTRLAVELHDSVAQNLTGVSMEIDSGLRRSETLPPEATVHFTRAVRMLGSCRKELRNCLWDLRSRALEESDMNKAIRLTLNPVLEKVTLYIRFNVPRSRLTDNTAHAILRIIRELATNAIRHGHATILRIAGSIDGETLRVSVGDNGCGFNPTTAPGASQGHFGLQGIRERVASLGGTVEINSEIGRGAKVTISIKAAENEDKEKI